MRLLGLRGCREWGASATRPGRRGAARGRRGGPGRGMRRGPPPAPGRLSSASGAAGAERGRGGGGAQGGRAAGPSAAQRSGHRQPPPGCPDPRAAPPPATPAAPGGGVLVPGRGNRSRSRRREQRARASGARMLGERRRPGPGAPKGKSGREDGTRRLCEHLVGRGVRRSGRGQPLGPDRPTTTNLGTFRVTSPSQPLPRLPASRAGSAVLGCWQQAGVATLWVPGPYAQRKLRVRV